MIVVGSDVSFPFNLTRCRRRSMPQQFHIKGKIISKEKIVPGIVIGNMGDWDGEWRQWFLETNTNMPTCKYRWKYKYANMSIQIQIHCHCDQLPGRLRGSVGGWSEDKEFWRKPVGESQTSPPQPTEMGKDWFWYFQREKRLIIIMKIIIMTIIIMIMTSLV